MKFICPNDGKELISKSNSLACPLCKKNFNKEENLISFLDSEDSFYEGAFKNSVNFVPSRSTFLNSLAIWTINSGYLHQVKNHFKKGDTLLELGCAGGVSYFGDRFKMIGCDLSYSSLQHTRKIYEKCIHANPLESLPIPNSSVDGVISSFFWEHLDKDGKNKCLKELTRILKPGAKIIFLYDVKTENPFIKKFILNDPNLYQEIFLDRDGHVGYASIKDNLDLFRQNNFKIIKNLGYQKTFLLEPSVYIKFKEWNKLNFLTGFLSNLSAPILLKPYLFLLRVIDSISFFLPKDWARISLTISRVNK